MEKPIDTGGRPGFPRRDFHVQKSLNPLRCQPMTVSSLTIARAWRQPGHRQGRMTQKTLSAFRSNGRGLFRFRTATCCLRARISVWIAARSAKISMILCMPERVSGGDAKFQGFCDGWNKWEGQPPLGFDQFLSVATWTLPTSACPCIGSLARSGGISSVMTAPLVDYKIHWLKMMSVPESRAVVGRHDGINGRDNANLRRKPVPCLAHNGSTFSRVGASAKPGGVQANPHADPGGRQSHLEGKVRSLNLN